MTLTRISSGKPESAVAVAATATTPPRTQAVPHHTPVLHQVPHPPRYLRFVDTTENERIVAKFGRRTAILHNEALPEGYPPIIAVQNDHSVWDEARWPKSGYPEAARASKTKCQKRFLLNDDVMIDLCWIEGFAYEHKSQDYLVREVERRAWEKYGGPQGLKAQQKLTLSERKVLTAQARKQSRQVDKLTNAGLAAATVNTTPRSSHTNDIGGRQTPRRGNFPSSGVVEDNGYRRSLSPSLLVFLENSMSPPGSPALSISTPGTPIAGPSTPIRTPKSKSARKEPFYSPSRRDHSASQSQGASSSKKIATTIGLTLDSEDDDVPMSTPSRKSATRFSPKKKASALFFDSEVIDISD